MIATKYRLPDAVKDPAEPLKVEHSFYEMCVIEWRPNEVYSGGEYVRPTTPNGFAYLTAAGGLSGSREPRWPLVVDQAVADGSVSWACKAPAANGLNAITSPSASVEPTGGMTVTNVSVTESYKILAQYEGGTDGQAYDVVFSFTLDGASPRIARQRVAVQKR